MKRALILAVLLLSACAQRGQVMTGERVAPPAGWTAHCQADPASPECGGRR